MQGMQVRNNGGVIYLDEGSGRREDAGNAGQEQRWGDLSTKMH
jgi:hypothetical protein